MRYHKICCFFIFFLVLEIFAQNGLTAQTPKNELITIRAHLVGKFHQTPIPFARIINKTQLWGVLSDTSGNFTISAKRNDTIYISSIGYLPLEMFVKDSLLKQIRIPTIWMTEKVYEMAEIDIQSLGTYQQFKYKILHLTIPQSNIRDAIASIQRELRMIPKHQLQTEASFSLGSPVTALYNLFSKEGKSLRKLAEAKEREKLFKLVNPKFNRQVVQLITGLNGDLLDQFMMFCKPADNFLMNASEYDIHERVLNDYERFMTMKRSNRNIVK